MKLSTSPDSSKEEELSGENSRSQSPWSALRDGSRRSAFLPYKPSVTVLTNLQRGNTKAQTPVLEVNEVSFHHRAAQGDLTIKDIERGMKQQLDFGKCHIYLLIVMFFFV